MAWVVLRAHGIPSMKRWLFDMRSRESGQVAILRKKNTQARTDHRQADTYAATGIRLANASGLSWRSDGAMVSSGLVVCPISSAIQHVGIF
jgi:hypothetical protein